MHNLADALRIVSILIFPFMHTTSSKIREQLGIEGDPVWKDVQFFDMLNGQVAHKGEAIFPRMDVAKELEELEAMNAAAKAAAVAAAAPAEEPKEEIEYEPYKDFIEFEDFDKIDLRAGTIIKAEKHPKADKLLVFQVDLGSEVRQIISGVAGSYTPEECVGKHVMAVVNLKPRNLRGLESNGMLCFGCDTKNNKFTFVGADVPNGQIIG